MSWRKVETARGQSSRGDGVDLSWNNPDWTNEPEKARDHKKTILIVGLGILSWVATYVGMLELIEANMGELPILHRVIIGFSVGMLMTMIIWLLDQLFAPINAFTKLCYAAGYVFLSIISVGFGFGFYWKVLESKGEGTRVAETAISQVQAPLQTAAARLEGLQRTLETLKTTSQQKAEIERAQGTSCPNSKPGDGPRRKLRGDDAARFSFASDVVRSRMADVKVDIATLESDLAKIIKDDKSIVDAKTGTRNEFMRNMSRKLDTTATNFNAFRGDPQLKQVRNELADRADKTTFLDTRGQSYSCPDQGLATMIRAVVASIDALPVLDKPRVATVEGSDATIEAFRRLTTTFFGLLAFKLPPSADELRDLQKKAVASVEKDAGQGTRPHAVLEQGGLSKRDYVPLAIAIFVDICLLLVSMGRPVNRLQGLVPKMRAAERGPVIQILSRFNEIHRDRQIRENFELFRHVVFDFNGAYYVAVPLDAPKAINPQEREDLRVEAQLLANLFTSFEKERIFDRVMRPLFTTGSVRKRLWRQGSKFAHAESFRIYKFKDGAWPDIILGAIMGAARRVEAEKRRRRIEDEIFADRGQTPGRDRGQTPGYYVEQDQIGRARGLTPDREPTLEGARRSAEVQAAVFASVHGSGGERRASASSMRGTTAHMDHAITSGSEHAFPGMRANYAESAAAPAGVDRQHEPTLRASAAASDNVARAANSNTAPLAEPLTPEGSEVATENVIPFAHWPHPVNRAVAPAADPETPASANDAANSSAMTVQARERTVTYTLPVAGGDLPGSLLARIAAGGGSAPMVDGQQLLAAPEESPTAVSVSADMADRDAPVLADSDWQEVLSRQLEAGGPTRALPDGTNDEREIEIGKIAGRFGFNPSRG